MLLSRLNPISYNNDIFRQNRGVVRHKYRPTYTKSKDKVARLNIVTADMMKAEIELRIGVSYSVNGVVMRHQD